MEIVSASHDADFVDARDLIAAMAVWDVEKTTGLGLSTETLVRDYYSDTPEELRRKFTKPKSRLLLSRSGGKAAGCIAFSASSDVGGEIHKLFVDPAFRGQGIARALMMQALGDMQAIGFSKVRLETVSFMNEAIALYRSFGFVPCEPFHTFPPELAGITLFFERQV